MNAAVFQTITAFFVGIFTFFSNLFGLPLKPMGQELI